MLKVLTVAMITLDFSFNLPTSLADDGNISHDISLYGSLGIDYSSSNIFLPTIDPFNSASFNDQEDCIGCMGTLNAFFPMKPLQFLSLQQLSEALNLEAGVNRYSSCFSDYGQHVAGYEEVITQENALYVCSCIDNMMEDLEIEPAEGALNSIVKESLASLSAQQTIDNLRIQAIAIKHDFEHLPHEGPLSCDLDNYIKESQCGTQENNSTNPLTLNGQVRLKELRPDFSQRQVINVNQFLYTPMMAEITRIDTDHFLNEATNEEVQEKFGNVLLSDGLSFDPMALMNENYFQQIVEKDSLSTNSIIRGVRDSQSFIKFIEDEYLNHLPSNHPVQQRIRAFNNNVLSEKNKFWDTAVNQLLKDIVSPIAASKCQYLKNEFDNICRAKINEDPDEIFKIAPDNMDNAYRAFQALLAKPEYNSEILNNLPASAGKFTEINHQISCQINKESLQNLYASCPMEVLNGTIRRPLSTQEIHACNSIKENLGNACYSYSALLENDHGFKELLQSHNLAITPDLLFTGEPKRCLSAEEPQELVDRQIAFRQLVDQYITQDFFSNTFAIDPIYGEIIPEKQLNEQDSGGAYNDIRSALQQSIVSDEKRTYTAPNGTTYSAEQAPIVTSSTKTNEVISITSQDSASHLTDPIKESSTKQNSISGIQQIGPSYASLNQAKAVIPEKQSHKNPSNSNEASKEDKRYNALMEEIERLNRTLRENNNQIQTNNNELKSPTTSSQRKEKLQARNKELFDQQEEILTIKENKEKQLAQLPQGSESYRSENDLFIRKSENEQPQHFRNFKESKYIAENNDQSLPRSQATRPTDTERTIAGVDRTESLSEISLTSSNIIPAEQFFEDKSDNNLTYTEPMLFIVDPQNEDMVIVCSVKEDKKNSQETFVKDDYICEAPQHKENVHEYLEQISDTGDEEKIALQNVSEEKTTSTELESFERVKGIIKKTQSR